MSEPAGPRFPFLLRRSVALTLFNSWVLFEEIVLDRLGCRVCAKSSTRE